MTRDESLALEVEYRESARRMRYSRMYTPPAPSTKRTQAPFVLPDKEALILEHVVIASEGLGPSVHVDDTGEVIGKFFTGGSILGLPVRMWYIESTISRMNQDRENIVLQGKKAKLESK